MKKIFILFIAIAGGIFNVLPCQKDPTPIMHYISHELEGQAHIYYTLGRVTLIAVHKGDGYKILILPDYKAPAIEYDAGNPQILDWAFQELLEELRQANYFIEEVYDPFYYELAYVNEHNEIEGFVSSMKNSTSDKLNNQLSELKKYLVEFWSEKYLNKNKGK